MIGPYDSVLGRRKDRVVKHMTTNMPQPFDVATGDVRMCGALAEIDAETGQGDVDRAGRGGRRERRPGVRRRRQRRRPPTSGGGGLRAEEEDAKARVTSKARAKECPSHSLGGFAGLRILVCSGSVSSGAEI